MVSKYNTEMHEKDSWTVNYDNTEAKSQKTRIAQILGTSSDKVNIYDTLDCALSTFCNGYSYPAGFTSEFLEEV